MEIVIDKIWLQYIVLIIGTIIFLIWGNYETKDSRGYLSGIGCLIPMFFFLIFIIIWLIIFFVIL